MIEKCPQNNTKLKNTAEKQNKLKLKLQVSCEKKKTCEKHITK